MGLFFQQKRHGMDYRGPLYAIKSSSKHPHTLQEGYETPQQQWMSLLIAQHQIAFAEKGPEI